MSKIENVSCNDCGLSSHESGYYLRKRKDEDDNEQDKLSTFVQVNCVDCLRPFNVLKHEQEWKVRCFSCYKKLYGDIATCVKCKEHFLVWESTGRDLCKDCYLSFTGVERTCENCRKVFYTDPNSKISKTKCYSCYLMVNGVRRRCIDCKTTIFVKESDLFWKKKCKDCYFST